MSLNENLSPPPKDQVEEDHDEEVRASVKKVEIKLLEMVEQLSLEDKNQIKTNDQEEIEKTILPIDDANAYPCKFRHTPLPPTPDKWPQRPLLLRPTPNTSTHIRGIRYASTSNTYEPLPEGKGGYCLGCMLPINNGAEPEGKSLVIDFETNKFIGTAMLRIKDAKPLPIKYDRDDNGKGENDNYFEGKKRTFQAIIRGKFICDDIPMSECVTGQVFEKPAGHLPPRLVLTSAVKVISTLAPQLQAEFHGNAPRFLSPLVSTAQSAIASSPISSSSSTNNTSEWTEKDDNYKNEQKKKNNYEFYAGSDESIACSISEPPFSSPTSLLQRLPDASSFNTSAAASPSQTARAKIRKKAFDKLYAKQIKTPTFDTSTEYTFEFYQHMLDFTSGDTLSLDMGKALGKHGLDKLLNEQPLKFMAAHQKITTIEEDGGQTEKKGIKRKRGGGKKKKRETMDWLWSFDIWHESLYPYS